MTDQQKLNELCLTNEARHLIACVWNFVRVWDDAVDGDKRLPVENINNAFLWALFEVGNDPFMRRFPSLWLLLQEMVTLWFAANKLEKTGQLENLRQSYVLRSSPYNFFISVVGLDAGSEAALEAALVLYKMVDDPDTFEKYLDEHERSS